MREITQEGLSGRLEKVLVERSINPRCSVALLDGEEVLVNGASDLVGTECLVRFDNRIKKEARSPISYFVSTGVSQVYPHFNGFAPEEYVFYGMWPANTNSQNAPHSYDEFSSVFDPGYTTFFVDIGERNEEERYLISRRKKTPLRDTAIPLIIGNSLPDYDRSSRVIMVKNHRDRGRVLSALRQNKLQPIELEARAR
tara:strand:+ start:908 stop:1501 length:594 start_codon:yes stop_codon:yes gene_type:complete